MSEHWWRTAIIYQVYPRSFADSNGDGVGDLPGITSRLDALVELGIDAIWLSPFMTSPQRDAGYDVADYCDVDPLFGTLADFDALLAAAHERGIRLVVDLVPNHSSNEHPWFREALAAGPGSPERDRYVFRAGVGKGGTLPPNNWQSVFGGPAWTRITEADGTPGPWYLHIFDSSQPDFDWSNPWVHDRFREVLRFWLDRGVDGFRVDVAHGLVKADGLPDYEPPAGGSMGGDAELAPYWGQDGVHEVYREWRRVLEEYDGERVLIGEAWVLPLRRMAQWVRPDEMHQTFNFGYLEAPWDAVALRAVVDESLAAFGGVGAPSTWVLSNHDVIRHPTRLTLTPPPPQGEGIGPRSPRVDEASGLRRGRAATAFMLALPGSSYLYQGEELGLPEVVDLPDTARQDPTFIRTEGRHYGRDGCRVPIPWEADAPAAGFSPTGSSWLPQPAGWGSHARDTQRGIPDSTLEFYRTALAARREHGLGAGEIEWLDAGPDVIALRNGGLTIVSNTGTTPVPLPVGDVVVASGPVSDGELPGDTTVWLRAD
ncbi:alpha-amylase family glycosyl hydrolase [Pseudolysinimonas sp.]|uniref:glycoside hydrolase family 13 protein n=1 Tax=Pseudolysinimonas sp. TaxID=2680009 RepID=UPI00286C74CC|nr:alpha-amylase family glycosyl hydrolase [Pseudolysinimonas sp.]